MSRTRFWGMAAVLTAGCGGADGPRPHASWDGTTTTTFAAVTAPESCLLDGPASTGSASTAQVVDLVRDADGRRLVVADDVAWLWDADGDVATVPVPPRVAAGALNEAHVVLAADDGWIEAWDAEGASLDWTVQVALDEHPRSIVTDVVVDPAGRVARATSEYAGQVVVAQSVDGEVVVSEPLETYLWSVNALRFVDAGHLVVAGDWYGVAWAELWDVRDPSRPERLTTWAPDIHAASPFIAATVRATALSEDGRLWMVGGPGSNLPEGPGFVGVVDVAERGDVLWAEGVHTDEPVAAVAVHDGLLSIDAAGTVRAWRPDLEGRSVLTLERESTSMIAVGDQLWVGGDGLHGFACP